MGLFDRKKTSFYDSQPFYTLGNSKTLLVVGLGNPGSEYSANRHNVGFMALDKYQTTHDFSGWTAKKDLQCILATGQVGSTRVILAKPSTFMNNSGDAVQKIQKFYQITNFDTIVVHDELDVNFGTVRTRSGGGSAGHNGIKSISELIGEDYDRLRIGIGPNPPAGGTRKMDSADFVLQDFSEEQQKLVSKIINEACVIIDERTTGPLHEHTVTVEI